MLKIYNTDKITNEFSIINEFKPGSWISLINPSQKEIQEVCKAVNIKQDFILHSLDSEEQARIDIDEDDNSVLFVIDTPIIEKESENTVHQTLPIGIIVVRDDFFITVSLQSNSLIDDLTKNAAKEMITYKKSRNILKIFYKNSKIFLKELLKLNKEKEAAEKDLNKSMENKALLRMLSLEKSLVYFSTSLKANELVMEKTMMGKIIKLYEEDEDLLEDAIIENRQSIEMTKIYSDILSGTMDAYASIISNNLNVVMKFLTLVTILLTIPSIMFAFWGMNVDLPFDNIQNAYIIVLAITAIMMTMAVFILKKTNVIK